MVVLPAKEWRWWVQNAPILGCFSVIREAVNCRALFYLTPRQRGDAVGYYQGLADLLEKRRVVENDRLIVSWDGSRLLVDAAKPRVEVVLEVA